MLSEVSQIIGDVAHSLIVLYFRDEHDFCLKKLRNVEDGGEDNNWDYIHQDPGCYTVAHSRLTVVKWVTHSYISNNNKGDKLN